MQNKRNDVLFAEHAKDTKKPHKAVWHTTAQGHKKQVQK
jgi:hypothetical protein